MSIDAGHRNCGTVRKHTIDDTKYPPGDLNYFVSPDFINLWTIEQVLGSIEGKLENGGGFRLFTLNLDHLSKIQKHPSFGQLYMGADFVTADGWPVAFFARRAGAFVHCVPGSELIVPICDLAAEKAYPVFLFGTTASALQTAAAKLQARYPGLVIAGQIAPPTRFDPSSELAAGYAEKIAASGARVCFVALGAPTQESFTDFAKRTCPAVGFICIGAGLDFIAGTQRRAPKAVRRFKMEWLWRWASSPRRLTPRYLDCIRILGLLLVDRVRRRRP